MKTTKVFSFICLIIICSASRVLAQVQVTDTHRGVTTIVHLFDTKSIGSSMRDRTLDHGLYVSSVSMDPGQGKIKSWQDSKLSNEDFGQVTLKGDLRASIRQPDYNYPHGMSYLSHVAFATMSPFTCSYSISGLVSGGGQGQWTIREKFSMEIIEFLSWTETEFSVSGVLPPGYYYFRYELYDYVFTDEPMERSSASVFDLVIIPEFEVSTEEISFGAVKALFR